MQDKISKQKISKNFYLDEFLCKCGKCLYSKHNVGIDDLVELAFMIKLQRIRDDFGLPMSPTSGSRCRAYNKSIGGAIDSGHIVDEKLPGRAVDISTVNYSEGEKYELLRLALKNGMRGIGIGKTFIHVDLKNRRAYWTY